MALRKPPLRDVHDARGATFTEFGGWDMPVEFESITDEHRAVREEVGIFDVSHMGEIEVAGPDAEALMQRLTTNDVTALDPGDSHYSMITDEDGVIVDDTVVYRLPEGDEAEFLFVPNAGHDEQMHEHWTAHRNEWDLDATVSNATDEYAMFALQGPDAPELLGEVAEESILDLQKFEAKYATVAGVECWTARTGYTGEDGFELVLPAAEAETVWEALDCQPCGLGARDTLRLEMGFLLSGQDFDHEDDPRNPYEAGVGWTVKLDTEFVGRDALERVEAEGVEEEFVGIKLVDRGVPRHGYDVTNTDDVIIGQVTSGTMSPTLGEPIALGYVPTEYADPGAVVNVVVRGQSKKAKIANTPFLSD
ncbi:MULTISPECIES: glycine cleavage system aminomethyltransferase GcvT [Halorussus]|uniref:glycine cleavage system aminomethyltransferase GcvT n=1 Tax=Halorussus TaxID=1070314 RepID=UPI0020A233EB|nr:glycine cleavage system aminomethyltransferase GcvT [Halorussus vallis]USZ76923.1 glycine cleavage system aminomethyltransferase GcvT [Halorussus vallis]